MKATVEEPISLCEQIWAALTPQMYSAFLS